MGALGTIATFLMGMVGPMAVRVLIALGFTAVTFTGVALLIGQLVSAAQASWAALPAAVLQLATLSGIPTGLGMVFGAFAAVFALQNLAGFKRYVLKTN